jgi:molybdenum cofactor guanylyltransferase
MMSQPGISTVILAGGRGTRIGGDKGLQRLHGRTLIEWVLDAVGNQCAEMLVSANDDRDAYAFLACPVIADLTPASAGPLAGLQAALRCAHHDLVASVPCDTPFLPKDLIARLYAAISTADAEAAVAVVEGRRQPTIALYRNSVLPSLDAYLDRGERRVGGWLDTLHASEAVFADPAAFININSQEELAAANHKVSKTESTPPSPALSRPPLPQAGEGLGERDWREGFAP